MEGAFEVDLHLGTQRREYIEYPGRLGLLDIVAWDVQPEHVARVIVNIVAEAPNLRFIVQSFGVLPFQGWPYHVFEGFKCTLDNIRSPEMEFSQAALRMVVTRPSTRNPGTRVGVMLYPLGRLILESMANGLGELRVIGVSHGALNSSNVVIQTDNENRICVVKLKGYVNGTAFDDSWYRDFRAYGRIARTVLGPYLDHYPEGHNFVERFSNDCFWMMAAYAEDPALITRHPMFFDALKWLFFLCTLADYMDAFRSRLEDYNNGYTTIPPSLRDHEFYTAITELNLPSWNAGLF